jgi:hypothetical protein
VESEHDEPKQAAPEAPQAAPEAPQAAPEAPQAAPESKTPGVSGRKVFLGLAVAAVIIFAAYFATRRSPLISTAESPATSAAITLVTSDRTDLDCVSRKGIRGFYCGFSTEIINWQGDEQNKLKPYYTLDRHLYLIPGLFLEPAVTKRYQSEVPTNKPREQLKRFTARCQIKVVGKLTGVRTRWLAGTAWSNPEDIEVATVSDCKVEG